MSPTFFCLGILWILSHQTTEVLMLSKSVFFQYCKKKFQIRAFTTEHNNGDPEPLATSDCKLLKLNVTTIIRKNVLQWRLQTGILCKRHKTFIITLISFDIVAVTGMSRCQKSNTRELLFASIWHYFDAVFQHVITPTPSLFTPDDGIIKGWNSSCVLWKKHPWF